MEQLRILLSQNAALSLAIGGLVLGLIFGAIVFRTNFCAMGGVSDMMSFGDKRRFRAWLLAGATALIGAQAIAALGVVDLSMSMYLSPSLNWIGNLLGGVVFGFGMVLTGGCTSKNMVRAGGGDLRSVVVLMVTGVFAYITIGGVLGPLRAQLQSATAISLEGGPGAQSVSAMLAGTFGMTPASGTMLATVVLAGALLVYCFSSAAFRTSGVHILSGVGVGLCVVGGWALTGLAYDDFAVQPVDPISLTFVRPSGDTLEWLQRYTAIPVPGFGVASVFGTILGAFLVAVTTGNFRFTGFADPKDTRRNLAGAAMMGVGGVVALGCTIGQAVTGLSTLALGSILTFVAIVVGGMVGVKYLERLLLSEA